MPTEPMEQKRELSPFRSWEPSNFVSSCIILVTKSKKLYQTKDSSTLSLIKSKSSATDYWLLILLIARQKFYPIKVYYSIGNVSGTVNICRSILFKIVHVYMWYRQYMYMYIYIGILFIYIIESGDETDTFRDETDIFRDEIDTFAICRLARSRHITLTLNLPLQFALCLAIKWINCLR